MGSRERANQAGETATVVRSTGWMRDAQPAPVSGIKPRTVQDARHHDTKRYGTPPAGCEATTEVMPPEAGEVGAPLAAAFWAFCTFWVGWLSRLHGVLFAQPVGPVFGAGLGCGSVVS